MVEGIQGVAGIRVPSDDFLRGLRQTTTDSGTLLILDEIQSGMGRSGSFFAHQPSGIRPDIITMAQRYSQWFSDGRGAHSPDHRGPQGYARHHIRRQSSGMRGSDSHPVGDSRRKPVANAARTGEYLLSALREMDGLTDVRGRGLMIGIDLADGAAKRRDLLFRHHSLPAVPASIPYVCSRRSALPAMTPTDSSTASRYSSMNKFTTVADIKAPSTGCSRSPRNQAQPLCPLIARAQLHPC